MKIASIDIGTNSMRLLIADYEDKFKTRKKYINITRMGQSVDKNGYINNESFERNLTSIKEFKNIAVKENVEEIYAIGTSALRDSRNKEEFINKVNKETGIKIEVIPGNDEAVLGFIGVQSGISSKGEILVIDIGGGSTEFIVGSEEKGILFSKSIDIGAVRLTEKFIKNDPPIKEELLNIKSYIDDQIKSTIEIIKSFNIEMVVGIGGTITTLSAINKNLAEYNSDIIHNSVIKIENVEQIKERLIKLSSIERKKIDGLQPERSDIIIAGTLILETIMKKFDIKQITISEYDNLEGLIYKKLKERCKS